MHLAYSQKGREWRVSEGQISTVSDRSVLDTCPLRVIDPLSPELLRFHKPDYNPKKGCVEYKPLTALKKGKVEMLTNETSCKARCLFPNRDFDPFGGEFQELPTNRTFECDLVETECNRNNFDPKDRTERYLHMQIHENSTEETKQNSSLPNVYVVLLDSTSSFMAKR
ncbi:hypothetical protein COOONC_28156 [Cooperia oncophora]